MSKHVFPARKSFGVSEREAVLEAMDYYAQGDREITYEGFFQKRFESEFTELMTGGGLGFSTAVCTGSVACYLALKALDLPVGSEVVMAPVTDSGPLMAALELGLVPVVADTATDTSYNASFSSVANAATEKTRAVFLVHSGGIPMLGADIQRIRHELRVPIVEDCSQAPFATFSDVIGHPYVGTLGDVAAFSTMYRKQFHSGSSGGMIFTKNIDLHRRVVELADRGRPKWSVDYRSRDPGHATRVALNFNTDEFSCAIGSASLRRVKETISKRHLFLKKLTEELGPDNVFDNLPADDNISPFFYPLVLTRALQDKKSSLCEKMLTDGVPIMQDYTCFVHDWELSRRFKIRMNPVNAARAKKNVFNLFLNENYSDAEAKYVAGSVRAWLAGVKA
jgi:dTDP-4-amino-4,6-dideoxygalactose transaminase